MKITVNAWQCKKCGHKWVGRQSKKPLYCPRCHNPKWGLPKRAK